MTSRLKLLRRSEVSEVVTGWNSCFPYDKISEKEFRNTVFGDPNYESAGNMVAVENERVVGFAAAVAREGTTGRDGAGTIEERGFGYIKGLFVLNEYRNSRIGKNLLDQALRYLKSKNKKIAKIGQYTGKYFSPGIDIRYEEDLRFFQENDFRVVDVEEDVSLDLKLFRLSEYQRQAMKRIRDTGVVIQPYKAKFLVMMRDFVERISYPQWFPERWESSLRKKEHHHLVARRESSIVGWARFYGESERWWFGPIAVLRDLRRKGIGTCLLLESVIKMKALGAQKVTAGWANVPFYVKNRWKISRRYSVLQKSLI